MSTDTLREQAKAIRQQHESKPQTNAPKESPREARWRVERERAAEQARKEPHKGY